MSPSQNGTSRLAGFNVEAPARGATLSYPDAEVVGWVLGQVEPVRRIELALGGEAFRQMPVNRRRPDLAAAFGDLPWAGRCGFTARFSLAGIGDAAQLHLRAVMGDGEAITLAELDVPAVRIPPLPAVAMLDGRAVRERHRPSVLTQDAVFSRVYVRRAEEPADNPGFLNIDDWRTMGADAKLVWLSGGEETVATSFLARSAEAIMAVPEVSFVAASTGNSEVRRDLVSALSGAGLGAGVIFRIAALDVVGGIDANAPTAIGAQWDLVIRLVAAGHSWVTIAAADAASPAIPELADEGTLRWLYRKHAGLFESHLQAVLLQHEAVVGELLRDCALTELAVRGQLRRRLHARRLERDRLGGKLHPHDGVGRRTSASPLGDLPRFEVFGPAAGARRGTRIDEHLTRKFFDGHRTDIRGAVLCYREAVDTTGLGGPRVTECDVFDADAANPRATILAELDDPERLGDDRYDCLILAQYLAVALEPRRALDAARRVLKPGGVLLGTVRTTGPIELGERDGDGCRFSPRGLRRIVEAAFGDADWHVRGHGDRTARAAFLAGLTMEDLGTIGLEDDPAMPLVVGFRAVNGGVRSG